MTMRRIVSRALVPLACVLCAVPALAQDTDGTGRIRGIAVSAAERPVAGVAVCVTTTGQCDVTAVDGRFAIAGVRAGAYRLEIVAADRPALISEDVEVRAGLDTDVVITVPELEALQQSVTVTAPAFTLPEEIRTSAFLVSSGDVTGSAGALQDVSRYVQSLPGVVFGSNDFRNDLIVRGGSPLENLYVVDNVEIPNLNSFATFASAGGTVSMLDAALLRDVTFLSGGFPAAYGNRTSSVLQITQREGSRTGLEARATVGFAGAGTVVEGPVGGDGAGSWVLSFRRSFLDVFTKDVGIGGVPVQYTLNGKVVYDATPRDRLWLVNLTGVDKVRLGLTEQSDLTSDLSTVDIRYRGNRTATGVNWQRVLGTKSVGLLGVSLSRASVGQDVKDLIRGGVPSADAPVDAQIAAGTSVFREDSTETEWSTKYDLTTDVPAVGKLQAGGSLKRVVSRYETASPFGSDSPYFAVADVNPFSIDQRITSYLAGGYVQATRAAGSRLNATLGVRFDRFGYIAATSVGPRASVDFALTSRISLNASYGRYAQQPPVLFLAAYPENRGLRPLSADHYVAGFSYRAEAATRVTVEVYRKRYRDYPVSSQVSSLSLANVGDTFAIRDVLFPMVSGGQGVADGIELFAERKAVEGRWHGQINLAVSNARHAGLDRVLRPGSFDSRLVGNLVGGYRLTSKWDLSLRLAYLSGRPFTRFDIESSIAQRRGVYDVSRVNAERLPDYFRADLRVDRHLTIGGAPVTIFGGVQNATGRRNVAGYTWDRRANRPRVLEQTGVFPVLGLDWSF